MHQFQSRLHAATGFREVQHRPSPSIFTTLPPLVRRGFLGSLLERPGQPGRQLVSPLIGQAGVAGQIHEDDRRRSRWLGDRARPREASIASNPSTIPAKTVDDLQKYLDRAESLGGKTIVPPTDMGGVQFAHPADPQGTGFGLVPPPTT